MSLFGVFQQKNGEKANQVTTRYAGMRQKVTRKKPSFTLQCVCSNLHCGKEGLWQTLPTVRLIRSGYANTTSYLRQNTGEKRSIMRSVRTLQKFFKDLCKYKGVEVLEGHLMPDHVHLLVSIPPKLSVSQFVGYLKGKSALMIFERHANLKYKYGNRHFWARGYYVTTVGLNDQTVRKYIREQEKEDIMMDRLSVKEYEDPFQVKQPK